MLNKKFALFTVLALTIAANAVAAPSGKPALTIPVNGTVTSDAGGAGVFNGAYKITAFAVEGQNLVAKGYVVGTISYVSGAPGLSIVKSVTIPVDASAVAAAASRIGKSDDVGALAVCDILNLELGPLHLDLLGLTIDLNLVVLDIAAETGAGNLLGNLLCAVTGLLDGVGALVDIARLLNQILDILTGVLG